MCVIIAKPQDKIISKETLKICWENNSHGAGFAYVEDGLITIVKELESFDKFYEKYQPHEEKSVLLHFRIKTHGEKIEDNTHPFKIGDSLIFAHNGTISKMITKIEGKDSDTVTFNKKILQPLYASDVDFYKNSAVTELIAEYVGTSKLVFFDLSGDFMIINQNLGTIENGIWYSNKSFEKLKVVYSAHDYSTNEKCTECNILIYNKHTYNGKCYGCFSKKEVKEKVELKVCPYCKDSIYSENEKRAGMCFSCESSGVTDVMEKLTSMLIEEGIFYVP